MLLNFVDACLKPTVECSSTAEDDYSEANLIAEPHTREFTSGFMAYSVVKPPVELLFRLLCPIELHSIALGTRMGSLKSNGFEIWVKGSSTEDFKKIGQLYNIKEDGCVFFNTFTADKHKTEVDFFQNARLAKCPLFLNLGFRDVVTHVKITIRSTERCVPVLKQVQIYGLPARTLSAAKRCSIMKMWEERPANSRVVASCKTNLDDNKPADIPCNDNHKRLNGVNIPDEFLDCITFEIMSLPMILPSGKIIDKSTIDRHSRTEESCWGRAASDPFTGVPFTARSKPVLNAMLKSRIDKFLLQNQHHPDIKNVARTVGSITTHSNKRPAHLSVYTPETSAKKCPRTEQIYVSCTSSGSFSIEASVNNALRSMTRFTKVPSTVSDNKHNEQCYVCDSDQSLYKIRSCKHLMCRECLLRANQKATCKCGIGYLSTDVLRYFKKTIA